MRIFSEMGRFGEHIVHGFLESIHRTALSEQQEKLGASIDNALKDVVSEIDVDAIVRAQAIPMINSAIEKAVAEAAMNLVYDRKMQGSIRQRMIELLVMEGAKT